MKVLFFCLSLAVWPALGGQPKGSPAPITLYTEFQQEPSTIVWNTIRQEVEAIMAPSGVTLEWRSLSNVRGNETSVELAVIKFKGRCDIAGLNPHASQSGALGWTHVSDGIILPFTDVDCTRIREFLQPSLVAIPGRDREQAFGRAIGRVLAHELYHIFAKTAHHSNVGVAKAAYSVRDLLSEDFVFEEHESNVLRINAEHHSFEPAVSSR